MTIRPKRNLGQTKNWGKSSVSHSRCMPLIHISFHTDKVSRYTTSRTMVHVRGIINLFLTVIGMSSSPHRYQGQLIHWFTSIEQRFTSIEPIYNTSPPWYKMTFTEGFMITFLSHNFHHTSFLMQEFVSHV